MTSRTRPEAPRGSTLVLAVVLLAVLSLVAVTAVALVTQERTNVAAKGRRDMQLACANAARMVVYAELAKQGAVYLGANGAPPEVTLPDGTKLSQTHYDTVAGMTVKDITPVRNLAVMGNDSAGLADLTNTFTGRGSVGGSVSGYQVVARCVDPKGRDLEVEFVIAFAL